MKKTIKKGKNIGIAEQVQGLTIEVMPHPKFKGMWSFVTENGDKWLASDYAFVSEAEGEVNGKKN